MVTYPIELKLNRANSSDTKAHFLDLNLCISNGSVSIKSVCAGVWGVGGGGGGHKALFLPRNKSMIMKVGGVIQYEPEIPYCKHRFSFKMYHTPLYLPLFIRQML